MTGATLFEYLGSKVISEIALTHQQLDFQLPKELRGGQTHRQYTEFALHVVRR